MLMPAASSLSRNAQRRSPDTVRIEVAKKDRKLIVYSGRKAIRTYRIGLGANPTGPKARVGDGRTPEGDYYICGKNPHSRFYRSLALSYPNVKDAEGGLQERRITHAQYNQIARAIRKKRRPPWNTALGGEIFIHGNGSKTDWTLGCIALEDEAVRQLYHLAPVGTAVSIRP
jgi:murein L,D-transpeptidase YafK